MQCDYCKNKAEYNFGYYGKTEMIDIHTCTKHIVIGRIKQQSAEKLENKKTVAYTASTSTSMPIEVLYNAPKKYCSKCGTEKGVRLVGSEKYSSYIGHAGPYMITNPNDAYDPKTGERNYHVEYHCPKSKWYNRRRHDEKDAIRAIKINRNHLTN